MKKTLVSALTTALVVGAASTTFAAANPFADVPADHWAYDAVSELQAKGVVNGYAVDNTFRGNQNMTRYEMAQIIAKALAKVNTPGVVTSGTDKAMVDKLAAEFASSMTGREAEILVEKITEKDGQLTAEGYTANYIRTFAALEGRNISKGELVKGVITGSENENCFIKLK